MKRLLISLAAALSMTSFYSQNQDIAYPHVTPMTPNAAEFAKYADYPVSYYTGTPNTNIPLYEIDVDGFKLPISLNYHASGIRVDQEATWVGLGWSLDTGSRISRTINGTDDFMQGRFDRNHPLCEKGYYYAPDIDTNFDNQYRMDIIEACPALWGAFEYHMICDSEPDVFYYNLPGGLNGKFIMDKSRGAVLFDKSHNLKIEVTKNSGEISVWFKITDSEGNQYFYNQREITQNYTELNALNQNLTTLNTKYDDNISSYAYWRPFTGTKCGDEITYQDTPQTPDPLDTSWCITKIITKNGREINFNYDTEMQYLPTQESCEKYWRPVYAGQPQESYLKFYRSKVVNTALRLKSIEGDFGHVDFICSDRFDIKGTAKKLDQISIRNSTNTLLKSYKFNYSYFNDDYSGNSQYEHVFKRLKLNKVIEYSALEEPLNLGHIFNYYEGSFPAKNSKNVDYWGFQNGKDYGSDYVIGINTGNDQKYLGAKKDANFQKAIIGTLKNIAYPTGGVTEFKFESNIIPSGFFFTYTADAGSSTETVSMPVYTPYIVNEYDNVPLQDVRRFEIKGKTELTINCNLENYWGQKDPTYNYDHPNYPLGVLKRISPTPTTLYSQVCPYVFNEWPGQGIEIALTQRTFTLEAGTYEFIAAKPPKDVQAAWRLYFNYSYTPIITNETPVAPFFDGGGIRISEIKTDAKIRKFKYPPGSMPVQPLFYYIGKMAGVPSSYGNGIIQVSESKTPLSTFNRGNAVGYDWVEEYLTDEEGDVSTIKTNYYNEYEERFDSSIPNSPVYVNYTNGLTKSIEKFTTKKGSTIAKLVEKQDFVYTSTYNNLIKAFRDRSQTKNEILDYFYILEWPLPSQVIKTEKTDDGKSIISETNYTYNAKDLLQSTSYSVDNSVVTQKMKYPFEYSNDAVSQSMTAKNMIGMPLETISLKDNVVTQATKTEYSNNSDLYLPKTIYKAEFNDPVSETNFSNSSTSFYKPVLNFDKYSSKGNLLEFKHASGMPTYYVWGYNEQYPIAKLENFTSGDATAVQNFITAAVDASNLDNSLVLEDALRTALEGLRNAAPNAMVTTYTYDPLIGVTSITDPKGYTIYYQYDSFNRLKQVVDMAGNIVSKNEYNYKQ